MMPKTPKWWSKYWNKRLNVLFRFAHVDLGLLDNDAFGKLLNDILDAVGVLPIGPGHTLNVTRETLRKAQRGLDRTLKLLLAGPMPGLERAKYLPKVKLKLAATTLAIYPTEERGYSHVFGSSHLPTLIYITLAEALKALDVKQEDILHCSHCDTMYVPLRKPRKGTPNYCSQRCAVVIASRMFRKRQAEAKLKKKGQSAVNVMKSRGKL
jgi:hypothetical protein